MGNNSDYLSNLTYWLRPVMRSGTDWKLCWRASRDGWNANTFHYLCDEKGPTITIIRVGKYIFGGYTSLPWPSKYYNEDDLRVQCEVYPTYWSVCVGCLSLQRRRFEGSSFFIPPYKRQCSTENNIPFPLFYLRGKRANQQLCNKVLTG